MNTKKFIIGTLAGGITYFLLGFIVYAILLEGFFAAHAGSATGVPKTTEMQYWPLFIGNLGHAALLSYVFLKWADIKTFNAGLMGGMAIGFFMTLGFDMVSFDTTNIMDMTGAIADVFVFTVISAIVGGVVGAVLGMGNKS